VAVVDPATNQPQGHLNEIEFIHGFVFANVWLTNDIVIINPASGAIVARWDMSQLAARVTNARRDVLNGIAYTPTRGVPPGGAPPAGGGGATDADPTGAWGGSLWVTGKRWDTIFELALSDVQAYNPAQAHRRAAAAGKGARKQAR